MRVTTAVFWLSGLNSQTSVPNCRAPTPGTRPATMNHPLVVAGEYAARTTGAATKSTIPKTPAMIRRAMAIPPVEGSDEVTRSGVYRLAGGKEMIKLSTLDSRLSTSFNGAVGRTRTGMGYPIRPSNVRVYQFHHDGMSVTSSGAEPRV